MENNGAAEATKERLITVATVEPNTMATGKPVWNVEDGDGVRFSAFAQEVAEHLKPGAEIRIKYTEKKNGKYTNRYIQGVMINDQWITGPAKTGGFKPGFGGGYKVNNESIETQVCLKAAVELATAVLANNPKMTFGEAVEHTTVAAQYFKKTFFVKAATTTATTNGAKLEKELETVA